MQKRLFTITRNEEVADRTFRIEMRNEKGGLSIHSGQFVDIAVDGGFLRRPISVCDFTPNTLTLLYKVVGAGTKTLSKKVRGETLDVLTVLGNGFSPQSCTSSALLIGGGLGSAPLNLLCKELLALGKKVTVVLGFNRKSEIVLKEEFRKMGPTPLLATLDGSEGTKGFVTDVLKGMDKNSFDCFYCCGPFAMMKAVCEALPSVRGEASLEERMGCGVGFCYGCSCRTMSGEAKRVCKDGPVFKKEEIVW